jgi:hypothetical protein
MYAHLIKNLKAKPFPYILIITPTMQPRDAVSTWQVISRKEARTLAKEADAKPWNF